VNTRLDLAYDVGYISKFMEKPTTDHLLAVKRVLRYIAGTDDLGCHYGRKEGAGELIGYSDSNLTGTWTHVRAPQESCSSWMAI
jgi:hypothetical protein